jgi:hypothetical protein
MLAFHVSNRKRESVPGLAAKVAGCSLHITSQQTAQSGDLIRGPLNSDRPVSEMIKGSAQSRRFRAWMHSDARVVLLQPCNLICRMV